MQEFSQIPELDLMVSAQLRKFCLDFFPKSSNRTLESICLKKQADNILKIWAYDNTGQRIHQAEILKEIPSLMQGAQSAQIQILKAAEAGHNIILPDFGELLEMIFQSLAPAVKYVERKGYFFFSSEEKQFAFFDTSGGLKDAEILTLADILDATGAQMIAQQVAEAQKLQQLE